MRQWASKHRSLTVALLRFEGSSATPRHGLQAAHPAPGLGRTQDLFLVPVGFRACSLTGRRLTCGRPTLAWPTAGGA